jgi:diguanylate cyclase (GGDEF)-like protein
MTTTNGPVFAVAALFSVLTAVPLVRAEAPNAPTSELSATALFERGYRETGSDAEAARRDLHAALRLLDGHSDTDLSLRIRILLCETLDEPADVEKLRELLPSARDQGLEAGVLLCEGYARQMAGDTRGARALFERAAQFHLAPENEWIRADVLERLGYVASFAGDLARGLTALNAAQDIYRKLNDQDAVLDTMSDVAVIYNRMGDYPEAERIYTEILKARRTSDSGLQRHIVLTLHNLGRVYENLHDWPRARSAFSESLDLSEHLRDANSMARALRGLAAVALASDDPTGALDTITRAEGLEKQAPDPRLRAQMMATRGAIMHRLHRLQESESALLDAIDWFRSRDQLSDLVAPRRELAAVYAELGEWQPAFLQKSEAADLSMKLLQAQIDQRFAVLKLQYDVAARDRENAALSRENEAERRALVQARKMRSLEGAVIGLTAFSTALLAVFALHQRKTTRRMQRLAMTDELTGLPNRRATLGRLADLLEGGGAFPSSALILDIDHFKMINDSYGHPAGDEVLKAVAASLRAHSPEPAFCGRLGGEEFLVVLPGSNAVTALALAESIRGSIAVTSTGQWFHDARQVTASIGVASSRAQADSPSTLLRRADLALYAAKRAGRNRVCSEQAETAPEPSMHPTAGKIVSAT